MFGGSQDIALGTHGHDSDSDGPVVGWRGAPTSRHAVAARLRAEPHASAAASGQLEPLGGLPLGVDGARSGGDHSTGGLDYLDAFVGAEDPRWDTDSASDARDHAAGEEDEDGGRVWFGGISSDSDEEAGGAHVDARIQGRADDGVEDAVPAPPLPFQVASPSAEHAVHMPVPAGHSAQPAARTAPRFVVPPASMAGPTLGEPWRDAMPPVPAPPPPPPRRRDTQHQPTRPGARPGRATGGSRPGGGALGGSARRDELLRGGSRSRPTASAARGHGPSTQPARFAIREYDDVEGGSQAAVMEEARFAPPLSSAPPAQTGASLSPVTLPLAARLRLLSPMPTGLTSPSGGPQGWTHASQMPIGTGQPPSTGRLASLVHRLAVVEADVRLRKSALERSRTTAAATARSNGTAPTSWAWTPPLPPGAMDLTVMSSRKEADLLVLTCAHVAGALPSSNPGGVDEQQSVPLPPASSPVVLQLVVPGSAASSLRVEVGRVLRVHPPVCCVMPGVVLASWNVTPAEVTPAL